MKKLVKELTIANSQRPYPLYRCACITLLLYTLSGKKVLERGSRVSALSAGGTDG